MIYEAADHGIDVSAEFEKLFAAVDQNNSLKIAIGYGPESVIHLVGGLYNILIDMSCHECDKYQCEQKNNKQEYGGG